MGLSNPFGNFGVPRPKPKKPKPGPIGPIKSPADLPQNKPKPNRPTYTGPFAGGLNNPSPDWIAEHGGGKRPKRPKRPKPSRKGSTTTKPKRERGPSVVEQISKEIDKATGVDKIRRRKERQEQRSRNNKATGAFGDFGIPSPKPQRPSRNRSKPQSVKNPPPYTSEYAERYNRAENRASKQRVQRTAAQLAKGMLRSNPKAFRKNKGAIMRALRTQTGRELFVGQEFAGDWDQISQGNKPNQTTGTINPYQQALEVEQKNELRLRKLAQQRKAAENLSKRYEREAERKDYEDALATAQRVQKLVDASNRVAKNIQRGEKKRQQIIRRTTRQIAKGDQLIEVDGNNKIELPSTTEAKRDAQNAIEDMVGLNLSPVDAGLFLATGGVGRIGIKGAINAGRIGKRAADAERTRRIKAGADDLTAAEYAIYAAKQNKLGSAAERFIDFYRKPGVRKARNLGQAAVGTSAVVGQEYTLPFVESQVRALGQPGDLFKTAARNAIGTVVAPFVIGGNLGLTVKRAAEAPFVEADYKDDLDYITGPVKQLAKEAWTEIEEMVDVYTSKDVDRMTKATVEDYGIGPIFSAYYLSRPITKGATRAISKGIGDSVVVPAKGRKSGWERWNANAMGLRNPFTNADPINMRGFETINDIRVRRRKAGRAFGVKARADAMEAAIMASVTKPITEGRQAFNASPGGKAVTKSLEDWSAKVTPDREITVDELAGLVAQKGIDATEQGVEFRFDAQTFGTLLEGVPDGSPDALRIQAILSNPKLLEPDSPEQQAFLQLVGNMRVADVLHKQVREQIYPEGPEGRAKAQSDQNARDLQTLITYSQLTGKDVPERPETALETIREQEAALLAAKETATQAEKGVLARLEKKLNDAKEALRNREVQDRVRVREMNPVINRLREQQGKIKQNLRSAQNTLWLINSEGLQETMTQRVRELSGRISYLEKKQGPERGLSKDEVTELNALRAERDQIKGDQEQIAKLEQEIKSETREYERATKRLQKEEAKQRTRVDDRLLAKIGRLEQDIEAQKKVVVDMVRDTEAYRKEVVDTLTQREYNAIEKRIDEELAKENPDTIGSTQLKRKLLGRKKARLAKRNYELQLLLDSHRSLSDEEYDDLLVDLGRAKDDLVTAREDLATRLQDIDAFAERLANETTDAFEAARTGISYYQPGLAALRDDAIRQVERLEAEVQRLEMKVNNHDAEMPDGVRRDIDDEIAQNQIEMGVIENRLRQMTPEDLVALKANRMRAAVGAEVERKKRARDATTLAALQQIFDRYVAEAREAGLREAVFINQRADLLVGRAERGGPSGAPLLGTAREQTRTGAREASGDVERSAQAQIDTTRNEAKRQANERVSEWILANATFSTDVDGRPQIEFTREGELRLAEQNPEFDASKYYALDTRLLTSKHIGSVINALSVGDKRMNLDKLNADIQGEPNFHQIVTPSGEQRLAQKFEAQGQGQRFVLVEKDVLDMVAASEQKLTGWNKVLYELNRLSSKVVLGTSPSWALAQPIAEMLILVADQPNLVRLAKAWRDVRQMRKDPELARGLATLAGNNMGVSRQLRGSQQIQKDYEAAIKALKITPAGQFMREAAKLEVLGKFDKWKAAWIREVGVVAELDRELSTMRRAGKALSDQMDAIETYAGLLSNMTRAEQIKWLNSKEGLAAGERLSRNLDAALGNWTDIKPGLETFVGSTIFFYPFVRFSLRWTFETFPKRHPVRASMAMLYGGINAEMLERLINYDPIWLSDWAVAPIFTGEGDPISLVPLNRVSISGNALVEYGARDGNPLFNISKAFPPVVSAFIRGVGQVDEFGQPLKDPNAGFLPDREVGAVTSVASFAESLVNLAAPIREGARLTGIDIGDDFVRGFLNDGNIRALIPDQKDTPINLPWNDDAKNEDRRYSRPKPGQDENLLRDILRRNFFATIPTPTKYYVEEQHVNRLFRARELAQKTVDQPYPKVMYRNRYQSLAEAARSIMAERTAAMRENEGSGFGSYKRSPEDQKIVDRFLKISGYRAKGEQEKAEIEGYLYDYYQSIGVRMGYGNPIRNAVMDERRQIADTTRKEWKDIFSGDGFGSDKMPNLEQAKKDIAAYKREMKDNETGFSKTGPVNQAATVQVAAGKPTKSRRQLASDLQAQTRQRLKEVAQRNGYKNPKKIIDQLGYETDPTMDPATKIKDTKKGKIVTRYRGKKVLGDMTLEAMKRAERKGTLDIDENGRLTIPESRQAIAKVEQAGERVAKQQQKIDRLLIKAGGIPEGVPKKYRGLIRKWGAYLDREMEKNGLVGVSGGKPTGMSGAEYLAKIIQAESGWDERIGHPDNTSSAQAQGLGQFIPSTRDLFLQKFGVDAYAGPAEQIKAAAFHLDGNHTAGGLESYNPGFPADSDGTWGYYLNQDVGEMIVPNKEAAAKVEQARQMMEQLRNQSEEARKLAKNMGIPIAKEVEPDGTISWSAKPARKINGAWGGTERILDIGNGGDFAISSEKRDYDTVDGDGVSDHYVGATNSYAHDLPTTDDAVAWEMMNTYWERLKLNEPLERGTYKPYTSRRFPGYQFQILWQVDGHYDHVHIGVKYTGQDLPPGTYSGAGPGGSTAAVGGGGSGGVPAAGGGSAGGGGQGGGGQPLDNMDGNNLALAESQASSEDSIYAAEQVFGEPQGDDNKVESIAEVVDALPSVKKRKQDLLRFDPSRRI